MNQDQERRLESIIGIVGVAEQTPTHAQYHRAVTLHEGFKRRLVVLADEPSQQLPIGQVAAVRPQHGPP
jgi:hypothetical protein